MIRAYHFVGQALRDGRPVPADGVWLDHDGPLVLCESGLHASVHPLDALRYAPGATLCLVDLDGEVRHGDDKVVARRRRIVARMDAMDLLWSFARQCALDVIHLWDAPAVVRQYLETGDETIRDAAKDAARAAARAAARWTAAWSAARAATWDGGGARGTEFAARSAAWDAAWGAARACDVARGTQRKHFAGMVDAAFGGKS